MEINSKRKLNMPLKSKNYLPPLGWTFYESLTGWTSPNWLGFDDTVRALIAHRQANRGRFAQEKLDFAQVSVEVEQQVEARLRQTYGAKADQWLEGAPSAAPPNFPWNPLRAPLRVPNAAGANKVKLGVGLLLDFLGPSLKAVPHELAEKRAAVCVTCPKNQKGGLVAHLGGEGLKLMLQARTDLKLETSHDAKLYDCEVCSCNLHIKPHVNLAFILERTTPEQIAAFPDFCWIKKQDK